MLYYYTDEKTDHQNPHPNKNGSSNTQTLTSQTASTNCTDQSRSFCSDWELGTTDLMPSCTARSRLVSLKCAHTTQTSWLADICCSTAKYMMLWGGTCSLIQYHWGESSVANWRSWGGQRLSWGQQAFPFSVRRRRRRHTHAHTHTYVIRPKAGSISDRRGWKTHRHKKKREGVGER